MTVSTSIADYSSTGTADSKGAAYIEAMSNAPSGNHWALKSINYSRGYLDRHVCTVIWEQK